MKRLVAALTACTAILAWVLTSVMLPAGTTSAALQPSAPAATTVTTPGGFTSVAPSLLLDTRSGVGAPRAAIEPYGMVHLQVSGRGGVPASGVSAVVLNVTVTEPTGVGFVTVYSEGLDLPKASNLNFVAGQAVPNLVVARVGHNGMVDLYNGSTGTVQLIADVSGYYLSGAPKVAGAFGSSPPTRLLDTRIGMGAPSRAVPPHGMVHLQVTGRGGVPDFGAAAVVLNVTVTTPTRSGNVSVYGDGTDLPGTPNLNFAAAQTVPNLVITPIGANGKVTLYNGSSGTVHLIADLAGSYLGGTSSAAAVSAGAFHSCAVTTSGGVKCWGSNQFGQLGDGTTRGSAVPVGVAGLGTGVSAVSSGAYHSCAVTTSGGVKCWGANGLGGLGNGTTVASSVPVGVSGLDKGVVAVSVSASHSCAVTTAGAVRCWGSNAYGELGDGTTSIQSLVPVGVVGLASGVAAVSAGGAHSCAVTKAGAVRCWGANFHGELGDGTTTGSAVPVDVVGLGSGVARVSAGMFHSCALTSAAAVSCWGLNRDNELGNGSDNDSAVPVDVIGLGSGVVALSAGMFHTCVLTPSGAVKCWGKSSAGALGNGTTLQPTGPVSVAGLRSGLVAVSAGGHYSCAVTSTGEVRCWGLNGDGELGDGTTTSTSVPVPVVGLG